MRVHFLNGVLSLLFIVAIFMFVIIGMTGQTMAQEKVIVLATMNWEPVYAKSLPDGGVFTVLTREVFKRAGYRLDVKFVPWKRAIEMAKIGKYDGVMGAILSSEREKYFIGTNKIMYYESFLYTRIEENITYTALTDLKVYQIGTIRGTAPEEKLKSVGLNVNPVGTYEQNFKKLMKKRIDLMEGDMFTLSQYPEYKGKIKKVTPPILKQPLVNIISKTRSDHAIIVADFNRELHKMIQDGSFDTILKKYRFDNL